MNIEKIEAAALAATTGEWKAYESRVYLPKLAGGFDIQGSPNSEANADFIATANPSTVLELITRLKAAENEVGRLEWIISLHPSIDPSVIAMKEKP